jgi:bifunctional non-homologous end joining protein LigD
MPLKRYREKRDFSKTPEPLGKKARAGRIFVVQKHEARRTHYDLRLECEGVLKSWAVPKGFSTDPKVKHLAVMVEDHPLDYASFEGVIPEGEYGAGPVMVWDAGKYQVSWEGKVLSDKQIMEKLARGELSVEFFGRKLKGVYILIKRDGKQWLLFKKKDEYAGSESSWDENSVLTNRTMEQIENNLSISKPEIDLSGLPKRKSVLKPMLAETAPEAFDNKDWIFEVKWDGYRVLAECDHGRVRLNSRNQKDYTDTFSQVANDLKALDLNAVLDGEVTVLDEKGRPDFQRLQNHVKELTEHTVYFIFDILSLDGKDLTGVPLSERRRILEALIRSMPHVRLSQSIPENGKEFYRSAIAQGLEGVMAKKIDSKYWPGKRSVNWLKIKSKKTEDIVICGWNDLKTGAKGIGSLILGRYVEGKLEPAGKVGSGLTESADPLIKGFKKLAAQSSPFGIAIPEYKTSHWLRPELVALVEFTEKTEEGKLRHPVFLGLRDDKSAEDLYKDSLPKQERKFFSKTPPAEAGESKLFKSGRISFELTHLDKIFWPEENITKGDLISYYQSVASYLLPFLKDRPQSLNRFPNGINEQSFYQKNNPELPDWVTSVDLRTGDEGETIRYIYCNDLATLMYLVQLGCIEMNVWNSRRQKEEFPDYMVIDLDPEDIDFEAVIVLAKDIKKLLDKIRVKGFCKTSGATGLHIYIPLGAKYTHEQSRLFAEAIATIVAGANPDIASVERNPEKRQKKVYIDYLQNRRGQTMAAPYCVRPRPGAPVSMPLRWEEVKKGLDPRRFNIYNTLEKIKKSRGIWKPVLEKGIDLQKSLIALEKIHRSRFT